MKSLDHYWYSRNPLALLLWPFSLLFRIIVVFRKLAYRTGVLKSFSAPKPVIIIGNISVGGTGKTPLIIELCKLLAEWNIKAGVISRGYGGTGPWPHQLNNETEAAQSGDEPVQIYQRTNMPVVVGPNRVDDVNLLCRENDIDLILADDGLQHYRLQRDFEIVVIDSERKFGNGFLLPAGPLREPVSSLSNKTLCVYNGGEEPYAFNIRPLFVKSLQNSEQQPIDYFKHKFVHAVAAIGHPQRFFNMLRELGLNVIEHAFPDHHQFSEKDLKFSDSLPVLMTEKDSVKCKSINNNKLWYVAIDIALSEAFINEFKKQVVKLTHG